MSLHKVFYSIAIGVAVIVGYMTVEMLIYYPQRYMFCEHVKRFRTTGFYVVIIGTRNWVIYILLGTSLPLCASALFSPTDYYILEEVSGSVPYIFVFFRNIC